MDEDRPLNPKLKVVVVVSIVENDGGEHEIVSTVRDARTVDLAHLHVFDPTTFVVSKMVVEAISRYFQTLWRRAQ